MRSTRSCGRRVASTRISPDPVDDTPAMIETEEGPPAAPPGERVARSGGAIGVIAFLGLLIVLSLQD